MYKVLFQANNQEYTSEGDSIFEAFGSIPLNSLELKTKVNVIVTTDDNRKAERRLSLFQGRMILRNHLRRSGFARFFQDLLK